MMIYRLNVELDDNDTVLVTSPDFPEVTTFAEDEEEDIARRGLAAIEEAIAARMRDGEDIPRGISSNKLDPRRDHWVQLPLMDSLKVHLYLTLRGSEVETRAELARRMKKPREQIDRLFRLGHASKTDQIESAFKALGHNIDVRIRDRKHT